jgi:hypothetical protein
VTGVEVAPLAGGAVLADKAFIISCDTVLLSVGLVPENELASTAGIALDGATGGPVTDSRFMTSLPGVFVAGNALHIHDLVDNVVEEAELAGASCADWLDASGSAEAPPIRTELPLRAGKNVRYTVPSTLDPSRASRLSLRSMIPIDRATLSLSSGGITFWSKKLSWVRPGEMLTVELPALGAVGGACDADPIVDVSLVDATEGNA